VDAIAAGQLSRSLDPLHSISYFLPETGERFSALGMKGRTDYFATRSAPMGAVSAEVVAATFYSFNPELVARSIPAAWELASPQTVTTIRYEIIEYALPGVLGDLARSQELARAAEVLRRAAEAIPNGDGRPLYAAHATLPWPESAHGRLWHAVTLLREYRGDAHIAALISNELSGLDALITHTVTGMSFSVDDPQRRALVNFARLLRGWSDEQWKAGVESLRERGLVDDAGTLTSAGNETRSRIEDLTDRLAYPPWRMLSDGDGCDVAAMARAIRAALQTAPLALLNKMAAGPFPGEAPGPWYGEHR